MEKFTIQTDSDVLKWATAIVEGNGEKFIALTKSDSFVLAKWVLKAALQENTPPPPQEKPAEDTPPPPPPQEEKITPPPPPPPPVTETAQECFDRFLKWASDNKAPTKVMDFSTGTSSTAAAFAWWLFTRNGAK